MFINAKQIVNSHISWRDELFRLGYRHSFLRTFPSFDHIKLSIEDIDLGRETDDWTFYHANAFADDYVTLRFCFKDQYDAVYAALVL